MTFREPAVLTGLALLPLAAAAYAVMQRRRRADAARFGNPALLPGLATARPGWRRHLPPFLLLLALGALVIAMARPQRSVAAPQRQATVMMVTDVSGSMRATDVEPDRLSAAVEAGHALADKLPDKLRLGLVSFSDYAEQTVPPTTERQPVEDALDRLVADGGTAMGDALRRGIESARTPVPNENGSGSRRLPAVIVLLSDGKNTSGNTRPLDVARQAKALKIPIYAIALGTPSGEIELTDPFSGATQTIAVPPDPQTLKEVARITGGRFFGHAQKSLAGEEPQVLRWGHQPPARPGEPRRGRGAVAGGDDDDAAGVEMLGAERERARGSGRCSITSSSTITSTMPKWKKVRASATPTITSSPARRQCAAASSASSTPATS